MPSAFFMFRVGEKILETLWVGSLWTVGYLVAPTLFALLDDRATAGRIAGELFHIEALISAVAGTMLLAIHLFSSPRRWTGRCWLIVSMVGLLSTGEWLLRPFMATTRLEQGSDSELFAMLHGVSALLYLIAAVLGLALVAVRRET